MLGPAATCERMSPATGSGSGDDRAPEDTVETIAVDECMMIALTVALFRRP